MHAGLDDISADVLEDHADTDTTFCRFLSHSAFHCRVQMQTRGLHKGLTTGLDQMLMFPTSPSTHTRSYAVKHCPRIVLKVSDKSVLR
jgi:hypothetical protein